MSEGLDFLGFHIQWKRKRGTSKWYIYNFIADRLIRSLKAKIRALTSRTSQQDLGYVLARLSLVMHGWRGTSGTRSRNRPSARWITSPGDGRPAC